MRHNTVAGNFGDGIAVGKFANDGFTADTFNNEISENLSSANLSPVSGRFANIYVATGSVGNQIHDNEALNIQDDNFECGTNNWHDNTYIFTSANNADGAVGTISAALSGGLLSGPASCAQ